MTTYKHAHNEKLAEFHTSAVQPLLSHVYNLENQYKQLLVDNDHMTTYPATNYSGVSSVSSNTGSGVSTSRSTQSPQIPVTPPNQLGNRVLPILDENDHDSANKSLDSNNSSTVSVSISMNTSDNTSYSHSHTPQRLHGGDGMHTSHNSSDSCSEANPNPNSTLTNTFCDEGIASQDNNDNQSPDLTKSSEEGLESHINAMADEMKSEVTNEDMDVVVGNAVVKEAKEQPPSPALDASQSCGKHSRLEEGDLTSEERSPEMATARCPRDTPNKEVGSPDDGDDGVSKRAKLNHFSETNVSLELDSEADVVPMFSPVAFSAASQHASSQDNTQSPRSQTIPILSAGDVTTDNSSKMSSGVVGKTDMDLGKQADSAITEKENLSQPVNSPILSGRDSNEELSPQQLQPHCNQDEAQQEQQITVLVKEQEMLLEELDNVSELVVKATVEAPLMLSENGIVDE